MSGRQAVGAVAQQGTEGIGQPQNFGIQADLLETQATRITAAIPTLVMPGNGLQYVGWKISLAQQQFQRCRDMCPNLQYLLGGEGLPLIQDGSGNLRLAHILQQRGNPQFEQGRATPAQVIAQQQGMHGDFHGVIETVIVDRLQPQQPHQRIGIAPQAAGQIAHTFAQLPQITALFRLGTLEGLLQGVLQSFVTRFDVHDLAAQGDRFVIVLLPLQKIE